MNEYRKEMSRQSAGELQDPGNLLLLVYIGAILGVLIVGVLWDSAAAAVTEEDWVRPEDAQAGELLLARDDGRLQRAPLLAQQVNMQVSGITARVQVEQHFVNSGEAWIEAIYVFPLPDESSVDHLRLRVGERVLEGRIMEKEAAERTHEQAKAKGRKSSLLVQNRPNIFTSRVANIGPGEEVSVEIEYQQMVRFADGIFSLRFPMVVGPRYIPGRPLVNRSDSRESSEAAGSQLQPLHLSATGWAVDTDQVPDASEITPPVDLSGTTTLPVTMAIDLAAGMPLSRLESLYHGIEAERIADGHYSIHLTGEVKADRDFVLEWQAEDAGDTRAALFAETTSSDQYMLLMLMPPQATAGSPVAREMIFIVDVSGSMAGTSIVQAKAAISLALARLQPTDHFNVIVFSNTAEALFPVAKPADQVHLQQAATFIDTIRADGGTEMKPALLLALDGSYQHQRLRQVVFLTDGAVGNEEELLQIIARRLGDSRLFTVGIGSAPNSSFMDRAAVMGRGTFSSIGKQSEVREKMTRLFAKLEHPVISDLRLDLGGSEQEVESYPSPIPDLYLGEPLVLAVKIGWQNATLQLSGTSLGRPWQTTVDTSTYGERQGIGAIWARKKIRSLMESLALGADRQEVRREVVNTALEHHLVSRYTSLVAVDTQVSRPQGEKVLPVAVKTHLPQGWQMDAVFGGGPQTATPATLRLAIGCSLLFMSAVMALLYRRRRWHGSGKE